MSDNLDQNGKSVLSFRARMAVARQAGKDAAEKEAADRVAAEERAYKATLEKVQNALLTALVQNCFEETWHEMDLRTFERFMFDKEVPHEQLCVTKDKECLPGIFYVYVRPKTPEEMRHDDPFTSSSDDD